MLRVDALKMAMQVFECLGRSPHMDLDADKERKLLEEFLFSVRLRAKNSGVQAQLLAHRRDCGVAALFENAR